MPARKPGPVKWQRPIKETQESVLKAMERKLAKIAVMEIVINEPRKASVREEIRAAASTNETKKKTGK